MRHLQKNLAANPQKRFDWHEWEYYLKLTGDYDEAVPEAVQQPSQPFTAGAFETGAGTSSQLFIEDGRTLWPNWRRQRTNFCQVSTRT